MFWAGDENCQWTTMDRADCLWESSKSSDQLQRRRGGRTWTCCSVERRLDDVWRTVVDYMSGDIRDRRAEVGQVPRNWVTQATKHHIYYLLGTISISTLNMIVAGILAGPGSLCVVLLVRICISFQLCGRVDWHSLRRFTCTQSRNAV